MNTNLSDEKLKWTDLEKNILLKTPIASIYETLSKSWDGQKNKYITIDSRDWVTVIPVKGDDFIMVKQWRHGEKSLSIEFPGGVIDENEQPIEGAKRELREETGCISEHFVYLGKINPNPAFMTNHFHVFAAFDLQETGEQNLDKDEYLNCFKMNKNEVFKKMGSSEMPHALMTAALLLFRQKEAEGAF